MISTLAIWNHQRNKNRPLIQDSSDSVQPRDPNVKEVPKVTANCESKLSSMTQSSSPPSEGPGGVATPTMERGERLEIEDKVLAFPSSKPNIASLIHSYRAFPPHTRQVLAIAGISVASLLCLLTIFYFTRVFHGNEAKCSGVIFEHTVEKHLEVDIQSEEFKDKENGLVFKDKGNSLVAEYRTAQDFSGGGAKDNYVDKITISPSKPAEDEELSDEEEYTDDMASPGEDDIEEALVTVRKTVDADRKMIQSKELRMWSQGAEQMRVLLVSTWHSGANFLSEFLQTHPGVFQHYEPLSYIGPRQVRSGKEAFQAQQVVHRLLDCKYDNLNEYMNYTKSHLRETIGQNQRVWTSCKIRKSRGVCGDSNFLSEACQMFPVQLVKTARLRLNLTHLLLNDQKLHAKVLFMVRDPRDIMNTRFSTQDWCSSSPDCSSAEVLCQDMLGDLKVASAFEKFYPDRFLKIKYEDFAKNPESEAAKIISFLNLEFSKIMRKFLREKSIEIRFSKRDPKRKFKSYVASWKQGLPLDKIHAIQSTCSSVLKELKYDLLSS